MILLVEVRGKLACDDAGHAEEGYIREAVPVPTSHSQVDRTASAFATDTLIRR